jgi:hypothetical protein
MPSAPAALTRRARAVPGVFRRNVAVLVLLAVALGLRVVAMVAIWPGIWFSDSNGYIAAAATGRLPGVRVAGYSLVIAPFMHLHSAAGLIVLQHLLGLAIVVGLYALLVRRGVPRWLAVLGVVPAAIDPYLFNLEHAVMSETVYHSALVGSVVLLLWRDDRPRAIAALGAGLLFGYAGVVRSVAIPLVAIVVVYLLVRRVGWRAFVAFAVGWALVAGGYATMFDVQHGVFAFERAGGRFLYARVATFADCPTLKGLPANERFLCPDPRNLHNTNWYLWSKHSPIRGVPNRDPRVRAFAVRVIRAHPLAYARVTFGGVGHYFLPGHPIGANGYSPVPWQWPMDPLHWNFQDYRGPVRLGIPSLRKGHKNVEPNVYVAELHPHPRANVGASQFLHRFQTVVYTYGPLEAALFVLVLVAAIARRGAFRLRLDAAFLAMTTMAALIVTQALSVFSYRYGLIMVVLLPPAAAMAGAALLEGRRRRRPREVATRRSGPATAETAAVG